MDLIETPEAENETPISILKFSKLLGCSHTSVQNAIAAGKIDKGVYRREGKPDKILPSIARKEWGNSVSIKQIEQNPALVENLTSGEPAAPGNESQGKASQITEYEAREKYARARMAELNLAEREGSLISLEKVNELQRAIGTEIRAKFESLGDRNIDNILAAASRNEALLILDGAIAEILTELANLGYEAPEGLE